MIYVVLGMHKSGTTLISQILHHSGINMGDEIDASIAYDQGNQYERIATWMLNEDILGCRGRLSEDIAAPKFLSMIDEHRRRMRDIIYDANCRYIDWGFKDPRTTLVYPLWAQELPEHKIIAIHRPIDQLWQRYRQLHHRYRELDMAVKVVQRWIEYNAAILQIIRETNQAAAIFDYGQLMSSQSEFERLQDFVGRDLQDRRRRELYRNRHPIQSLPLEFAKWWGCKKTGHTTSEISERLKALGGSESVHV